MAQTSSSYPSMTMRGRAASASRGTSQRSGRRGAATQPIMPSAGTAIAAGHRLRPTSGTPHNQRRPRSRAGFAVRAPDPRSALRRGLQRGACRSLAADDQCLALLSKLGDLADVLPERDDVVFTLEVPRRPASFADSLRQLPRQPREPSPAGSPRQCWRRCWRTPPTRHACANGTAVGSEPGPDDVGPS